MNSTIAIALGIIVVAFVGPGLGILVLVALDRWTARSAWKG